MLDVGCGQDRSTWRQTALGETDTPCFIPKMGEDTK
jgi:hypothetical protein